MNPSSKKKLSSKATVFMMVIGLILLSIVYNHRWAEKPYDPEQPESILFFISAGETGKLVSHRLEQSDLISSSWQFYRYLIREQLGNEIKTGQFLLSPSMTPSEIAATITETSGDIVVTIPEGWSIAQIDDRLTDFGLIQNDEFVNHTRNYDLKNSPFEFLHGASSLEGYLFPDTFYVDPTNFSLDGFTERLLTNFENKVFTESTNNGLAQSPYTLDEIVNMASIIEREALWDQDRAVIAGILWKRLENNWRLDADATLIYITGDNIITAEDLELESPYNTRKYEGLPPTAISNPGLASIQAAINPLTTDYWFYLTDLETGKAHYAETNEQHNENRVKYL